MTLEWDEIRRWIALFSIITGPGMVLFWVPFHGLGSLWKRTGSFFAYVVSFGAYVSVASFAWLQRDTLLSVDLGHNLVTTILGATLIVGGFRLRRSWARKLPVQGLLGLAEVDPESYPVALQVEGAYARVRHPRYLDLSISLLGQALLSNYAAAYVAFLIVAVLLPLVILLEERELQQRYGAPYSAYRDTVPAIIPVWPWFRS